MRKVLIVCLAISLLLGSFPVFANNSVQSNLRLSSITAEIDSESKEVISVSSFTYEGETYTMVIYEDNSTLVFSPSEYSYSYILDNKQHILSSSNDTVTDVVYNSQKNEPYEENHYYLEQIISPFSEIYEVSYESIFHFFKYVYRSTNVNRQITLYCGKGDLSSGVNYYTRSTSPGSPLQAFEYYADNFHYYLTSNNTLKNPDFVSDLFSKANLYYPTLSYGDKTDIVDFYAETVEKGYKSTTSTMASAIVTGILNKIGSGFASATSSFVNAGFSTASFPVIMINYSNLENSFNSFKTAQ